MEQLVFLDTNLVYILSFIHALKNAKYAHDGIVAKILLNGTGRCSMLKTPQAVAKTIRLYRAIMNGTITPYICPVVCCEIMHNKSNLLSYTDKNDHNITRMMKKFINNYCTVCMPAKEFQNDFTSQVYDLQQQLKSNSVQIGSQFYGLNDEGGHKDLNDRIMLSQLAIFSQYTDEKLLLIKYGNIDEKTKDYLNKTQGKITNKKHSSNKDFPVAPIVRDITIYHNNQRDMGREKSEQHCPSEFAEGACKLANGIDEQLRYIIPGTELNMSVMHVSGFNLQDFLSDKTITK